MCSNCSVIETELKAAEDEEEAISKLKTSHRLVQETATKRLQLI